MTAHLRPRKEQVHVSDLELELRPLSLYQHEQFTGALADLNFEALVEKGAPLWSAISGEGDWVGPVLEFGGSILKTAIQVLGPSAGKVLTGAVGAALDTKCNHEKLLNAAMIPPDSAELDHGIYVESPALRRWVQLSCTVPQAVSILESVIEMNAYGEMGKAVADALKAKFQAIVEKGQEASTGDEAQTESRIDKLKKKKRRG